MSFNRKMMNIGNKFDRPSMQAMLAFLALSVAVSGCAGNAEVRKMSETFRDQTPAVQEDLKALKKREAALVELANANRASHAAIRGAISTARLSAAKQACAAAYGAQLAALQEKRADLSAEINKGAATAIGRLEKTIENAADESGVSAHAAVLLREQSEAANADRLSQMAADMRLATYALSVTAIENEFLASGPKRIANSANRMQQRLLGVVAAKKRDLDARLATCEKDAEPGAAATPAPIEPYKTSEAYDHINAYLEKVKEGSGVWIDYLDANGFGTNSLIRGLAMSALTGAKNAALGLDDATDDDETDLQTLGAQAAAAAGVDAAAVRAAFADFDIEGLTSEAGLNNPAGLLLGVVGRAIEERFEEEAPKLKSDADAAGSKAVKEMTENQ